MNVVKKDMTVQELAWKKEANEQLDKKSSTGKVQIKRERKEGRL